MCGGDVAAAGGVPVDQSLTPHTAQGEGHFGCSTPGFTFI